MASATIDERENVQSRPAAQIAARTIAIVRSLRTVASSRRATTSMYALARGETKVDTSRRNNPSLELKAKFSGRPAGPW
jgi:hypothetical protein